METYRQLLDPEYWTPGRGKEIAASLQYPILILCAAYIPAIFLLKQFMKQRKPVAGRQLVIVWNVILSALSATGVGVILFSHPRLFLCGFHSEGAYNPGARAVIAIFCLTKVVEFGDTVILVVKKRPTELLHVYHHLTVALYCWHAQYINVDFAHMFVCLNLCVHSIMYAYFAVSCLGRTRFLDRMKPIITLIQLLQMCIGVTISYVAMVHATPATGGVWSSAIYANAVAATLMYSSYGILFAHFFVKHYLKGFRPAMTVFLVSTHILGVIGVYTLVQQTRWRRMLLDITLLYQLGGIGITVGAHRLWSHRSYKANVIVRIVLMIFNSIANQGDIFQWSRDHRVHHKFSDTPADPHNALRGFFYSHMGWLLLKKPDEVRKAGQSLPVQDLLDDPVVRFQRALSPWWNLAWCFAVPAIYGHYAYGSAWLGFLLVGVVRWLICLHATWCVNSVSHFFGSRIYDPSILAADNLFTALITLGEGWHNYHHVYPFDYATGEHSALHQWNPSKVIIDSLARIGWVWDRKRATHLWALKKQRLAREAMYEHTSGSPGLVRQPSVKDLQQAIPAHCLKRSLLRSFVNLIRDIGFCAIVACCAVWCHGHLSAAAYGQSLARAFWVAYAVAQGTVAMGLWVIGHECAGGSFSDHRPINHVMGLVLHSLMLVPYRPRLSTPTGKMRISLLQRMREDVFAFAKCPMWILRGYVVGMAGIVAALAVLRLLAAKHGLGLVFKWYGGPYLVMNAWLAVYSSVLSSLPVGDDNEDGKLSTSTPTTFDFFTWDYLSKTIHQMTQGTRYPWTWLVNHLHHHLKESHILQSIDFNVPHYNAGEALHALNLVMEHGRRLFEAPVKGTDSTEAPKNAFISTGGANLFEPNETLRSLIM